MNDGVGSVLARPPSASITSRRRPTRGDAVECVCAELAAAWEQGRQPRIEEFESLAPPGGFAPLEWWRLVREEIRLRQAAGELPRHEEYQRRFGHLMCDWPTLSFPTRPPSSA